MVYKYQQSKEAEEFSKKLEAAARAYKKLPLTWEGRQKQEEMAKKLQLDLVNTLRNMEHRHRALEEDIRNFTITMESYGPGHSTDVAGIYFWFTGKQIRRKGLR